jgi:hypothetical protein
MFAGLMQLIILPSLFLSMSIVKSVHGSHVEHAMLQEQLNRYYTDGAINRATVAEIVTIRDRVALTQAKMPARCERAIWLRYPNDWRLSHNGLGCNYKLNDKAVADLTKTMPKK